MMDIAKLDTTQAVRLFGFHGVYGPSEAVLRLPANCEHGGRLAVDWSTSKTPWPRYDEPERGLGCAELARRVKERNGPACRLEMPSTNEGRCYILSKKGDIVVRREDFDGLTLLFTWRALPALRAGYLVEFTDDAMTISSEPPGDATDRELADLLWIHTDTPHGHYLEHISGVRTLAASHQQPRDPKRLIRPTPTPAGPPQCVPQFDVDGERRMMWTRNPNQVSRYNEAAGRLRQAMQNAPPPDDFDASMAQLDQMAREIESSPQYRLARRRGR